MPLRFVPSLSYTAARVLAGVHERMLARHCLLLLIGLVEVSIAVVFFFSLSRDDYEQAKLTVHSSPMSYSRYLTVSKMQWLGTSSMEELHERNVCTQKCNPYRSKIPSVRVTVGNRR